MKTIRNKFCTCLLIVFALALANTAVAQETLPQTNLANESLILNATNGDWRVVIDANEGFITSLSFRNKGLFQDVLFRKDKFAGPRFENLKLNLKDKNSLSFEGREGDVVYTLQYKSLNNHLAVVVSLNNAGTKTFAPNRVRFTLGVDTEMQGYPQWDTVLFPTLMRCEKSHFWGYFMGSKGRIIGIASPDPVASYYLQYDPTGHRIYTVNLDLLHTLPLPQRHPQNLTELKPNEKKTWTFFFDDIDSLDEVKPTITALTNAPMIEAERYTLSEGEKTKLTVWSETPVEISFNQNKLSVKRDNKTKTWFADFTPNDGVGLYTLKVKSKDGKQSEATIYVRKPFSWYLERARAEAINKPQKASTHRESWVGCFSAILAKRYFPDAALDESAEKMCRDIMPLMYDMEKVLPLPPSDPGRSQNHSVMISLLSTRYSVNGRVDELEMASRLADWLIENRQADDGSFRARSKTGVHYTSVHYMAKNMLELAAQEEKLAGTSKVWREKFQRHFESARRAIEDLLSRGDRVETEGQMTLEDSMIANTASQLALFALLQKDPIEREKYTKAAAHIHDIHRCLSNQIVPDARLRGATLRFWEAQYDVMTKPNMMNSPHGWTARKTPGTWYLYLLTGEEKYLQETMDAIGASMQLIDEKSGELRWSFIPDPYIEANVFVQDPKQPERGILERQIIGEQYLLMVSGWWKAPAGQAVRGYSTTIQGSSCDNDVHEVFKAMAEITLTSAFVLERANGEIVSWNSKVKRDKGSLVITPNESVVSRVHLNFKKEHSVSIKFSNLVSGKFKGVQWVGEGGVPELLRVGNSNR
jgi:hypothetical protein